MWNNPPREVDDICPVYSTTLRHENSYIFAAKSDLIVREFIIHDKVEGNSRTQPPVVLTCI